MLFNYGFKRGLRGSTLALCVFFFSFMHLTHDYNEAVKTDRYGTFNQPFVKTRRFN